MQRSIASLQNYWGGARNQELSSGQVLFNFRDRARYVFALTKGRIRLERYTCEGDRVTFQIIRQGESFVESALFSETYRWNAVAEVPASVVCYPKDLVWQIFKKQPHLALGLLHKLDRQNQWLEKLLLLRSIRSARDRLLQYIQLATPVEQTSITFDRSYKDIATELGLSSETMYRALADLEKSGMISRQGRKITLSMKN